VKADFGLYPDAKVKKVLVATPEEPDGVEVKFEVKDRRVKFEVPKFPGLRYRAHCLSVGPPSRGGLRWSRERRRANRNLLCRSAARLAAPTKTAHHRRSIAWRRSVFPLHAKRRRSASKLRLQGWVRTRRDSKEGFSFIELYDGSCQGSTQVIAPNHAGELRGRPSSNSTPGRA